ncbi:MAG: hypothetical protein ACNI25_15960 [Halarcobacter sp.]
MKNVIKVTVIGCVCALNLSALNLSATFLKKLASVSGSTYTKVSNIKMIADVNLTSAVVEKEGLLFIGNQTGGNVSNSKYSVNYKGRSIKVGKEASAIIGNISR